jgi:hypothetical protein
MKRVLVLALLALGSCQTGPAMTVFKPGSTQDTRQRDFDQCKIAALRDVPQSLSVQSTPGVHTPGTTQCNTIGGYTTCQQVGQINIAGQTYTSDANDGLRQREMERCMSAKGYSFVERPICTSEAEKMAAISRPQPSSVRDFSCRSGIPLDR